jgi:hypothetical protein
MKKYSIIIPTMWMSSHLFKMLDFYEENELIQEVIIIDNAPEKGQPIPKQLSKLKLHTKGKNIYVNPAWNFGVSLAISDYIIIANDDILFNKKDFDELLNKSFEFLNENTIIGPSMYCFKQNPENYSLRYNGLKIEKLNVGFTYGFGTFMIMKKNSYTIIPDDILIFHGDVIQHRTNDVFLFSGIEIDTPMSVTLKSDPQIHNLAKLDHAKSLKYDVKKLIKFK